MKHKLRVTGRRLHTIEGKPFLDLKCENCPRYLSIETATLFSMLTDPKFKVTTFDQPRWEEWRKCSNVLGRKI